MRIDKGYLAAALICAAGAAAAQDPVLTIFADGALLEHGGVVEVTAIPSPDAPATPRTTTIVDRYAQIAFRYPVGASYTFRFRPVPSAEEREGMDKFSTEMFRFGGRQIEGPDGQIEADFQAIRVFPYEEYASESEATRLNAVWGETQAFDDVPPANLPGARVLPWIFESHGDWPKPALICSETAALTVCTPDPKDALLFEALWWRSIAEGRLERLRHNALQECYDSGGLFSAPEQCTGEHGKGWPSYRPAD